MESRPVESQLTDLVGLAERGAEMAFRADPRVATIVPEEALALIAERLPSAEGPARLGYLAWLGALGPRGKPLLGHLLPTLDRDPVGGDEWPVVDAVLRIEPDNERAIALLLAAWFADAPWSVETALTLPTIHPRVVDGVDAAIATGANIRSCRKALALLDLCVLHHPVRSLGLALRIEEPDEQVWSVRSATSGAITRAHVIARALLASPESASDAALGALREVLRRKLDQARAHELRALGAMLAALLTVAPGADPSLDAQTACAVKRARRLHVEQQQWEPSRELVLCLLPVLDRTGARSPLVVQALETWTGDEEVGPGVRALLARGASPG